MTSARAAAESDSESESELGSKSESDSGSKSDSESESDQEDDSTLGDLWRTLSPTRRASCLAWLAFLVTWGITRLITAHGRGSGSGAAINIAGHHVHHYLLGIILLGVIAAIAVFLRPERGWPWLGIGYGIALALILDEYALLLNLSDVYWKRQGQLSVDVTLAFVALGGVYITAMTVVHEALRKSRHRLRRR